MIGPIDWLKLANIKGYDRIYFRSIDECKGPLPNSIFLIAGVINKNKSPERHEIIVLYAANNEVALFERMVDKQDSHPGDFDGSVGAVGGQLIEAGLHFSVTMDMKSDDGTARAAKYPAYAWLIDDLSQRRNPQTYKV